MNKETRKKALIIAISVKSNTQKTRPDYIMI